MVLFPHVESVPGFEITRPSFVFILNQAGWIGVDLFFVISGYLIGGLIFREIKRLGSLRIKRFFLRRVFRIFPVYYFLYFLIIISPESLGVPDSDFIPGLFFFQNYGFQLKHFNFTHSWSICVEEHFYITFPLLSWVLLRTRNLKYFPYLMLCSIPISLTLRCIHALTDERIDFVFYSHSRIEGIALGCLLAYAFTFNSDAMARLRNHSRKIAVISVLLLIPAFSFSIFESRFIQTLGITMTALSFTGIVFLAAPATEPGKISGILLWPVARIGFYSYTLYLIHPMMLQLRVLRFLSVPLHNRLTAIFSSIFSHNHSMLFSYIVLSISFAVVLSILIEKPFMYFRNRFIS